MPLCRLAGNRKDNFDSFTRGTTAETDRRNTNSHLFLRNWLGSCQQIDRNFNPVASKQSADI